MRSVISLGGSKPNFCALSNLSYLVIPNSNNNKNKLLND